MQLPSYRWRLVHLTALWGYGVSQPVFSLLDRNPEFLVFNGASRADIVTFALLVVFAPPLVVLGMELVAGTFSRHAGAVVHLLGIWAFGFCAALQVLARFRPDKHLDDAPAGRRRVCRRDRICAVVSGSVVPDPLVGAADRWSRELRRYDAARSRRCRGRQRDGADADSSCTRSTGRAAVELAHDALGRNRRTALPGIRSPRTRGDLVLASGDSRRSHALCRPGNPLRRSAGERRSAHSCRLPRQPVHPPRRRIHGARAGVGHPSVPGAVLPATSRPTRQSSTG